MGIILLRKGEVAFTSKGMGERDGEGEGNDIVPAVIIQNGLCSVGHVLHNCWVTCMLSI